MIADIKIGKFVFNPFNINVVEAFILSILLGGFIHVVFFYGVIGIYILGFMLRMFGAIE